MEDSKTMSSTHDLAYAIKSIASSLLKLREEFKQNSDIYKKVAHDLFQAINRADTAPDEFSQSISLIANYGWYVDPTWPYNLPERISQLIADRGYSSVELIICSSFEQRTIAIRDRLTKNFPSRGFIIESAFDAHERAKYELSVPIFLIQADGIAKEIFENSLFMGGERKKISLSSEDCSPRYYMIRPLLAALSEDTTLNLSSGKRKESFSGLNRHQVIHGESVDYATRPNSLKCISLLSNLCLFREAVI